MPEKKPPSAMIIPFGKHKGATVADVLATDPQYAEWMLGQAWFAERFAELHAALLTRGAGTDDTPEHNAIQARFMDPLFCAAFVVHVLGRETLTGGWKRARENEIEIRQQPGLHQWQSALPVERRNVEHWKRSLEENRLRNRWPDDWAPEQIAQHRAADRVTIETHLRKAETHLRELEQALADSLKRAEATPVMVVFGTSAQFERRGVDVILAWWFTTTDRTSRSPGAYLGYENSEAVEIKPSLGDDFPSVMRQLERLRVDLLLVGQHTGSLPLETVRQMFAANGRRLITVREIEAEIAHARALLVPMERPPNLG
jgi:hypothetical protein